MSTSPLPIGLFDYELPAELIAQAPVHPRDRSRLLVLPTAGEIAHRRFTDLPGLLHPGDLLVVNRTEVVPARLRLRKESGGKVEVLLTRPHQGDLRTATRWQGIGRPLKGLRAGQSLLCDDGTRLTLVDRTGETILIEGDAPIWDVMRRMGSVPLPPYIGRPRGPTDADRVDYQTVFAREPGAIAAPTAGLHFTPAVLDALDARGIGRAEIVLHVGPGTFLPVRQEHEADVTQHRLHLEQYAIDAATLETIRATKARGGKIVAVGTTSVRALETWAKTGARAGESELFIYPGFRFGVVDVMVTNFHLPKSTLLMLVSAFAGRERVLAAYRQAVASRYRFFSYGDAMLVYPAAP